MTKVSKFYGIGGELPFVDVDVAQDLRLFLDPHRVRLYASVVPEGKHAVACMDSFMGFLIDQLACGGPRVVENLERFTEPKETRLGMSRRGHDGHGGAAEIGSRIWTALSTDLEMLVRVGILRHLEDLPLFVEGVDRDITSDIATRIVFGALLDFTQRMTIDHPQLQRGAQDHVMQVWNVTAQEWENRTIRLPAPLGKPLVLVPATWVGNTLLMSSRRFFEVTVRGEVQRRETVILEDGTCVRPTKEQLAKRADLPRSRLTSITWVRRAAGDGINLLAQFREFVDYRAMRAGWDEAA